MEGVFNEICRQFILRRSKAGELGFLVDETGSYKGYDPNKREEANLDLVALNEDKTEALAVKCRYKSSGMDLAELEACLYNAAFLPCRVKKHLLFSKSGFYPGAARKYRDQENVLLFTLKDLY